MSIMTVQAGGTQADCFPLSFYDKLGTLSTLSSITVALYDAAVANLQSGSNISVVGPTGHTYGYTCTAPTTPGYYRAKITGTDDTGRSVEEVSEAFKVEVLCGTPLQEQGKCLSLINGMLELTKMFELGGQPASALSVTLEVVSKTINQVIVPAGTLMTEVVTGTYQYLFTPPALGLTYSVTFTFNTVSGSLIYTEEYLDTSILFYGLCLRSDVEQIYGKPNVYKWALLSNNDPYATNNAGPAEIVNRINWSINLSSTDFRNAMRQGGYALQPNSWGAPSLVLAGGGVDAITWQTNIVAIRAGLYLYIHLRPTQRGEDGRPLRSEWDGLFTYAEQQIDFVRARKLRLDAMPLGKGTSGPFVTHHREQGFYGPGQVGYGPPSLPENFPYG